MHYTLFTEKKKKNIKGSWVFVYLYTLDRNQFRHLQTEILSRTYDGTR